MSDHKPVVLAIAGVDPSGGAGIFADFRAIERMGARALGAVTALTMQTERSLLGYEPTPLRMLESTIIGLSEAFEIKAVKVGMLATGEIAALVARLLERIRYDHLVVDPVISASVGARLVDAAAEVAIRESLLPMATLLTPNMPEAAALAGFEVNDLEGMRRAAEALHARGARAVVVTGGHLSGDAVDVVCTDEGLSELRAPRLPGAVHGTGCAFSSAAAAALARGKPLPQTLAAAKSYVESLFREEAQRA